MRITWNILQALLPKRRRTIIDKESLKKWMKKQAQGLWKLFIHFTQAFQF